LEFVNEIGVPAGWTLGFDNDGRELLVIALKETFELPSQGQAPNLAKEQCELTKADEFAGEPGFSALLRETDYSPRKLRCDVLLNGSAYSASGRPVKATRVSLSVASMRKSFWVFGERRWRDFVFPPSGPEPFTRAEFSYGTAFGGEDRNVDQPDKVLTYAENPIGTGYHPVCRSADLIDELLPNTSDGPSPISDVKGRFRPMAFGHVGRNFVPRYSFAGTYDQKWLEEDAPLWPADFSYEYFQAAPSDQQVPFLEGGEEVEMMNLTPGGYLRFFLPARKIPVTCIQQYASDRQVECVCDTLLLEPDQNRFSLTYRASIPLRRNLFELKQVVVGWLPYSWHSKRRAQRLGKTYNSSLAEAVASRRRQGRRR
jgi:hypothetical protein